MTLQLLDSTTRAGRIGGGPARSVGESSVRTVRVALLGCGTVGGRLARLLLEERDRLRESCGVDLVLSGILVRDTTSRRHIPRELLCGRFEDLLGAGPDVVIELLGGVEPARTCIAAALQAGIPVVTANKTVIAHHGRELRAVAAKRGVSLAYEASVCSIIPILAALRQLRGDRIRSIQGIVNGSTNYILSRVAEGLSSEEALAEARERGLVEPDPSADLSGRDAAEKLCILASAAGCPGVSLANVDREGIENVTREDVLHARRHGFAIKLVAEFAWEHGAARLRVGPTLVPRTHRLAGVNLQSNGLIVNTQLGGELFLEGAGAGPEPTASAILGDVLRVLRNPASGLSFPAGEAAPSSPAPPALVEPPRRHFVRVTGPDASLPPAEVLAAFREAGVSLKHVDAGKGLVRVLTHPVETARVRKAVEGLRRRGVASHLIVPALNAPPAGTFASQDDSEFRVVHTESARRSA